MGGYAVQGIISGCVLLVELLLARHKILKVASAMNLSYLLIWIGILLAVVLELHYIAQSVQNKAWIQMQKNICAGGRMNSANCKDKRVPNW